MTLSPNRVRELLTKGFTRVELEAPFTAPTVPSGTSHRGLRANAHRVAVVVDNATAGQVRYGNTPATSTTVGRLLDAGGGFGYDYESLGAAIGKEWYFVGVTLNRQVEIYALEVYEP